MVWVEQEGVKMVSFSFHAEKGLAEICSCFVSRDSPVMRTPSTDDIVDYMIGFESKGL